MVDEFPLILFTEYSFLLVQICALHKMVMTFDNHNGWLPKAN